MDTGAIILCIVAIAFVIVLFFVADLITKNNAKKEEEKPKEEIKPPEVKKEEEVEIKTELNHNNLANDIEQLLTTDKKNDGHGRLASASRRSHLVNRSRMREYYDHKYSDRVSKYSGYGVDTSEEGGMTIGDMNITDEEARKLIALAEVLKRKE